MAAPDDTMCLGLTGRSAPRLIYRMHHYRRKGQAMRSPGWSTSTSRANPGRPAAFAADRPRSSSITITRPQHAARWLQWRRRHQARSRWFHH